MDYQKEPHKIILVGDSSVGKTSIINRLYFNEFSINLNTTISPGMFRTNINLPNKEIPINVWDTAGQEQYSCMVPLYSRNAQGVLIIFDLSQQKSFESAKNWFESLKTTNDSQCQYLLCGNKEDLQTNFNILGAAEWARENNIPFVKVSAKSGFNVKEIFQTLIQMIEDNYKNIYISSNQVDEILGIKKISNKCTC